MELRLDYGLVVMTSFPVHYAPFRPLLRCKISPQKKFDLC